MMAKTFANFFLSAGKTAVMDTARVTIATGLVLSGYRLSQSLNTNARDRFFKYSTTNEPSKTWNKDLEFKLNIENT